MLYAKNIKAVPQALADLGLLVVVSLMVFIAVKVRDFVNLLAAPAQMTADTALSLSGTMGAAGVSVAQAGTDMSSSWIAAADQVSNVALVGPMLSVPLSATALSIDSAFSTISTPFSSASTGLDELATSMLQLVSIINTFAIVVAILIFLVPVVAYAWKWLPWRFSFVRRASAGTRLLSAESAPELFALRAMATAPMHDLLKITPDPMGAWKAGNPEVIARLANLSLAEHGLKLPKARPLVDAAA
ncbi:MAG: hypothetical protein LBN10_09520 [Propionibacteriaceae bacterium]|jgi:hypothetical protein|nr:hypothetical protein [Propionibacteriaceae bacterium]